MESDGRKSKLEAGRQKFVEYQKKKQSENKKSPQKESSVPESLKNTKVEGNVTDNFASPREESDVSESIASCEYPEQQGDGKRDNLNFSNSSSGDISNEKLLGRISELEEIIAGMKAVQEEKFMKEQLSTMQSPVLEMSPEKKKQLEECQKRLVDYEEALKRRDELIEQMTLRVQELIQKIATLEMEGEHCAQEIALLHLQLQAASELIQSHHWETGVSPHDYLMLQNEILILQASGSKNNIVIKELNETILTKDTQIKNLENELEKKHQELYNEKCQSSQEIQKLMREVEEQHRLIAEMKDQRTELENKITTTRGEIEESCGLQLVKIKEELKNHYDNEKRLLEKQHSEEIGKLVESYESYKLQIENVAKEKSKGDIHELCRIQIDELKRQVKSLENSQSVHETESISSVFKNQIEDLSKQLLDSTKYFEEELGVYRLQVENLQNQILSIERERNDIAKELTALKQQQRNQAWEENANCMKEELQETAKELKDDLLVDEVKFPAGIPEDKKNASSASDNNHIVSLNTSKAVTLPENTMITAVVMDNLFDKDSQSNGDTVLMSKEIERYKIEIENLKRQISNSAPNYNPFGESSDQHLSCKEEIHALNTKLKDVMDAEVNHVKEISHLQLAVLEYKNQLEVLHENLLRIQNSNGHSDKQNVVVNSLQEEVLKYKEFFSSLSIIVSQIPNEAEHFSSNLLCRKLNSNILEGYADDIFSEIKLDTKEVEGNNQFQCLHKKIHNLLKCYIILSNKHNLACKQLNLLKCQVNENIDAKNLKHSIIDFIDQFLNEPKKLELEIYEHGIQIFSDQLHEKIQLKHQYESELVSSSQNPERSKSSDSFLNNEMSSQISDSCMIMLEENACDEHAVVLKENECASKTSIVEENDGRYDLSDDKNISLQQQLQQIDKDLSKTLEAREQLRKRYIQLQNEEYTSSISMENQILNIIPFKNCDHVVEQNQHQDMYSREEHTKYLEARVQEYSDLLQKQARDIEELTVQLMKTQSILSAKQELEDSLNTFLEKQMLSEQNNNGNITSSPIKSLDKVNASDPEILLKDLLERKDDLLLKCHKINSITKEIIIFEVQPNCKLGSNVQMDVLPQPNLVVFDNSGDIIQKSVNAVNEISNRDSFKNGEINTVENTETNELEYKITSLEKDKQILLDANEQLRKKIIDNENENETKFQNLVKKNIPDKSFNNTVNLITEICEKSKEIVFLSDKIHVLEMNQKLLHNQINLLSQMKCNYLEKSRLFLNNWNSGESIAVFSVNEEKANSGDIVELRKENSNLHNQIKFLQSEVRRRDLHMRHLELKITLLQNSAFCDIAFNKISKHSEKSTLEQIEKLHAESLNKLKDVFQDQLDEEKINMQTSFSSQLASLQQEHLGQMASLRKELLENKKCLQDLSNSRLLLHFGGNTDRNSLDDVSSKEGEFNKKLKDLIKAAGNAYEHFYQDLNSLVHDILQQKINEAIKNIKEEQETVHHQALLNQDLLHRQETEVLKANLEAEKCEELSNLRKVMRKKHDEEIIQFEEQLTNFKSECLCCKKSSHIFLDLFKKTLLEEMLSALQELIQHQDEEFLLKYTEISQTLENSLCKDNELKQADSSNDAPKYIEDQFLEMLNEEDKLTKKFEEYHSAIQKCTNVMLEVQKELDLLYNNISSHIQRAKGLTTEETFKQQISALLLQQEELKEKHRNALTLLSQEHANEVSKLKELLEEGKCKGTPVLMELRKELEAKHTQEMAELRQYFEKKVADVEKHYSEEITSQHSRKMSGSSIGSDSELVSDMYFAGGDVARVPPITHMYESLSNGQSLKESDGLEQGDFEKRLMEYHLQFETEKFELCQQLQADYENKVEDVIRELRSSHKDELLQLENKHSEELGNIRTAHEQILKIEIDKVLKQARCEEESVLADVKRQYEHKISELQLQLADQLASLKADQVIQNVNLEKQLWETVKEKYDKESNEKLVLLEEKYKSQLDVMKSESEKQVKDQLEQLTELIKESTEKEQSLFIASQQQIVTDLLKQHEENLNHQKLQYEAELKKAQDELELLRCEVAVLQATPPSDIAPVMQEIVDKLNSEINYYKNKVAELEVNRKESHCADNQLTQLVDLNTSSYLLHIQNVLASELSRLNIELESKINSFPQDLLPILSTVTNLEEKVITEAVGNAKSKIKDFICGYENLLQGMDNVKAMDILHIVISLLDTYKGVVNILKEEISLKVLDVLHLVQQKNTDENIVVLKSDLMNLLQERDKFKQLGFTFSHLVQDIIQYCSACEEELNHTIIDELALCENSSTPYESHSDIQEDKSTPEHLHSSETENTLLDINDHTISGYRLTDSTKKIHIVPNISAIFNNTGDTLMEVITNNKNLSVEVKNELEFCLNRLKSEASALLGLSSTVPKSLNIARIKSTSLEEELNVLSSRLSSEVKLKEELAVKVETMEQQMKQVEDEKTKLNNKIEELEQLLHSTKEEKLSLQNEVTDAKNQLQKLKQQMTEVLQQRQEDVSEGFGEGLPPATSCRKQNMVQLQSKAREILEQHSSVQQPHLQIIEQLCSQMDTLTEEGRKEREDLQQQVILDSSPSIDRGSCLKVDAADKQLRAIRQFLEEQAVEREQERDEFVAYIRRLEEQLKERDRERSGHDRLCKDVENLEDQLKEALASKQLTEEKKNELEADHKAAMEKIKYFREIVNDLESQIEMKNQHIVELEEKVQSITELVEHQTKHHEELAIELESLKYGSADEDLHAHILHLEDQLSKHRMHVEQFHSDSTAIKQMKTQLRDLEKSIERKTKELEALNLNMSSASCSSPSEDISIREQIEALRSDSPADESRNSNSPAVLPIDDIYRLQDKLQRHSRAEDMALKKIRDLEMQLKAIRKKEEEVVAERDALQERDQKHLLKISNLQGKLDEQRMQAQDLQQQAIKKLENTIMSLEKKCAKLQEMLEIKENQMSDAENLIEKLKQAANSQEIKWRAQLQEEQKLRQELQGKCQQLEFDKDQLQQALEKQESSISMPALLDSLVADKNSEIDFLTKKVDDLQSQLDSSKSNASSSGEPRYLSLTDLDSDSHLSGYSSSNASNLPTPGELMACKERSPALSEKYINQSPVIVEHVSSVWSSPSLQPIPELPETCSLSFEVDKDLLPSEPKAVEIITDNLNEDIRSLKDFDFKDLLKIQDKHFNLLENLIKENLLIAIQKLQDCSIKDSTQQHQVKTLLQQASSIRKECENKLSYLVSVKNEIKRTLVDFNNILSEMNLYKEACDIKNNMLKEFEDKVSQFSLLKENYEVQNKKLQEYESQLLKMESLKQDNDAKSAEITKYESQLSEALRCKEELNTKIEEFKKDVIQLEVYKEEVNRKNEMILEYERKLADAESLQEKLAMKDENAVELVNIQERNIKFESELNCLKQELEEKNVKLVELEMKLQSVALNEKKLSVKVKDLTACENELKELKEKNISEKEVGSNTEMHLAKLDHELKVKKCELDECRSEMLALQKEVLFLKSQLSNTKEAMASDSSRLQALRENEFKLNCEITNLRTQVAEKEAEITHLEGLVISKDDAIQRLEEEKQHIYSSLVQEQSVCKQLRDQLSEVQLELDRHDGNSLDDLTGLVQKELEVSAQLDSSMLEKLKPLSDPEDEGDSGKFKSQNDNQLELLQQTAELRATVEREQKRAMEFDKKLGSIANTQAELNNLKRQISLQEERLQHLMVLLDKERNKLHSLEEDLQKERNMVKHVQFVLESERQRNRESSKKDFELIETMRGKLENALDSEVKLRLLLDQANSNIEMMKSQLVSHKTRTPLEATIISGLKTKLDQLQEKCMNQEVILQREQRQVEELQHRLVEERKIAQQRIESERSTNQQLKTELHLQHAHKEALDTQLANARDQVSMQRLEIDALTQELQSLHDEQRHHQSKRSTKYQDDSSELQKAQNNIEKLELKIKQMDLQLKNAHEREAELAREVAHLQHEQVTLQQKLPSEPMLQKIRNVNTTLAQYVKENFEVTSSLEHLLEERQNLQTEVKELKTKLQFSENDSKTINALLVAERAAWAQERAGLQLALSENRLDEELEGRITHLFGRYFRLEKRCKALIWQKRYLLKCLGGYRDSEQVTIKRLAQLTGSEEEKLHPPFQARKRVTCTRFRIAAIAIIAIGRMRYLVKRWMHGQLIGSNVVLNRACSVESILSGPSTHRGVRSTSSSSSSLRLTSPNLLQRWGRDVVQQPQQRSIPVPSMLPEYMDRLDNIQQRLGLMRTSHR